MGDAKFKDGRKPGFFIIDNEIFDVYGDDLGPYGIAVYCALVRMLVGKGEARFTFQQIVDTSRVGRSTVAEMLRKLEDLKLIGRHKRVGAAGREANEYELLPVPKARVGKSATRTNPRPPHGRTPVRHTDCHILKDSSSKDSSSESPKDMGADAPSPHRTWVESIYKQLDALAKGIKGGFIAASVSELLKDHPTADPERLPAFAEWFEREKGKPLTSPASVPKFWGEFEAASAPKPRVIIGPTPSAIRARQARLDREELLRKDRANQLREEQEREQATAAQ